MEIQRLLTKQASLTQHTGQEKVALGFLWFTLFSVFDLNRGNTHFGFYFGEQKRIERHFPLVCFAVFPRLSHSVPGGLPGGCGHPMSLQLSWPLFPCPFGNLAGSAAYFPLWNFRRDGFVGLVAGGLGLLGVDPISTILCMCVPSFAKFIRRELKPN